VPQP
jgi:hypothetical protein